MSEQVSDDIPVDGYWLKQAECMVAALQDVLRLDLTARRRELIAEYLGGILDAGYKMGMRMGSLQERLDRDQSGAAIHSLSDLEAPTVESEGTVQPSKSIPDSLIQRNGR